VSGYVLNSSSVLPAIMALVPLIANLAVAPAAFASQPPSAFTGSDDPFTYCARVGTTDSPAAGTGPSPAPASLEPFLPAALGTPPDANFPPGSVYWRCMDRWVYVCAVGANLVCDRKPDRAKTNPGAESYCRDHPDAAEVPAYAAGHNSAYDWHCVAGRSSRGKLAGKLDHRGFSKNIWHKVSP
jgi:hypothetical protein